MITTTYPYVGVDPAGALVSYILVDGVVITVDYPRERTEIEWIGGGWLYHLAPGNTNLWAV